MKSLAYATLLLAAPAVAQDAPGKIVIYRPSTVVGLATACPVRYKGREVVELGRSKFTEWTVPAGSYILTNKTSSVEVNVHPGETRYVRCNMKLGLLTYRADLQIVDAESFTEHSAEFERKEVALPAM
jgi:hypothetical protein